MLGSGRGGAYWQGVPSVSAGNRTRTGSPPTRMPAGGDPALAEAPVAGGEPPQLRLGQRWHRHDLLLHRQHPGQHEDRRQPGPQGGCHRRPPRREGAHHSTREPGRHAGRSRHHRRRQELRADPRRPRQDHQGGAGPRRAAAPRRDQPRPTPAARRPGAHHLPARHAAPSIQWQAHNGFRESWGRASAAPRRPRTATAASLAWPCGPF